MAITSTRLLGFSSQLRHWGEQTLAGDEHVTTSQVLREFCLVATDQHLYGFQETLAHWTSEDLGASELVQDVRAQGHVALVVTTGFPLASCFTFSFASSRTFSMGSQGRDGSDGGAATG